MKKSNPANTRPVLTGDLKLTFKAPRVTFSKESVDFLVELEGSDENFTKAFNTEPVAFSIPRSVFKASGEAMDESEFSDEVGKLYLPLISVAMRDALMLLLADAVHIAAYTKGPMIWRQEDIASVEAQVTNAHVLNARANGRRYVRRMLGVPVKKQSKGRPVKWEREELRVAIVGSLMRLTNENSKSQACVVREMQKPDNYGKESPKSVGALRKALERHNLKWRDLKIEATLRLRARDGGGWGKLIAQTEAYQRGIDIGYGSSPGFMQELTLPLRKHSTTNDSSMPTGGAPLRRNSPKSAT